MVDSVDLGKQVSVESGDSSETESCLLKDRGTRGSPDARDEEEEVQFCVGDVRKRLSQHSIAPRKTYQRDPQDPSGLYPHNVFQYKVQCWFCNSTRCTYDVYEI